MGIWVRNGLPIGKDSDNNSERMIECFKKKTEREMTEEERRRALGQKQRGKKKDRVGIDGGEGID